MYETPSRRLLKHNTELMNKLKICNTKLRLLSYAYLRGIVEPCQFCTTSKKNVKKGDVTEFIDNIIIKGVKNARAELGRDKKETVFEV